MFIETTIDQNVMAAIGDIEMPQEEATQVLAITYACYTLGCHTYTC